MIFKLEVLVNGRWDIVPCWVRKPFYRIFLCICVRNVLNMVATIILYFTSWDETECRAFVFSAALTPGLAHLTVKTFHNCGEADCPTSGHSKSRRKHKDFGPDQSAILSERFQRQILTFLACFFLKNKLHLILPMNMQKSQKNVNFKGIKLALKNLGRFLSPTASRAVLRDKYQHYELYLENKTLRSYNFV